MLRSRIKVLGSRPYYDPDIRALCHAVKDGDPVAILETAALLAPYVPNGSILVPVPNHDGRAGYTLELAKAIRERLPRKDVTVLDALKGLPHPSLCEMKHAGFNLASVDYGFDFTGRRERMFLKNYNGSNGHPVFLVDNVIDTGRTARAAYVALGLPDTRLLALGNTFRGGSVLKGETAFIRNRWDWGRTTLINMAGGHASAKVYVEDRGPGTAFICDLCVDPGLQRNGLGSDLVLAALNEAWEMGADTALLWTAKKSWTSSWYKRTGFIPENIQLSDRYEHFYFDKEDFLENISNGNLT